MITKYDLMLIEFTSDGASWTIIQRSKHCSVSRMFLREKPQSVRFMIIVTDPCNVSTREVIKVSREVTEATPLMCAAQAPNTSDVCGASTSRDGIVETAQTNAPTCEETVD